MDNYHRGFPFRGVVDRGPNFTISIYFVCRSPCHTSYDKMRIIKALSLEKLNTKFHNMQMILKQYTPLKFLGKHWVCS